MLCQTCLTSTQAAYASIRNTHHESLVALYRSVEEGCWICRQLWISTLVHAKSEKSYESDFSKHDNITSVDAARFAAEFEVLQRWRMSTTIATEVFMITDKNKRMTLEFESPLHTSLKFTVTPLSANEAKSDSFLREDLACKSALVVGGPRLWEKWLRTCTESHKTCRRPDHNLQRFSPKRLVEIISADTSDSLSWKIARCADLAYVPYLTLSHCWGGSQHTCLRKENLEEFSKPSSSSDLPKSFRDAFRISLSLGFRFVWIDSLCIIQNDADDWEAEASIMGKIYKDGACNIAATWAVNGDDGCFAPDTSETITLQTGPPDCTKDYKISLKPCYYADIVEAPLNERGWVTQERFLAKKQLNFAKSQVYWECQELIASEEYPTGMPKAMWDLSPYNQAKSPTKKPTVDHATDADRRTAWAALVDSYSDCKFSRLSDKMIALAGLAEEMRDAMDDVYLAGLWKKDIQKQLCWATDFDVRRHFNRSLMPMYLAPTWSWANVNGPVMSDLSYHPVEISASCVEILDASVQSGHPSGLHSFIAGKLVLRGIAVWAHAMRVGKMNGLIDDDDWELRTIGLNTALHGFKKNFPVSIMWDENMCSSEVDPSRWSNFLEMRNSQLLCLYVHMEPEDLVASGLLLRKVPCATDDFTYVRMGAFSDRVCLPKVLSPRFGHPAAIFGHSRGQAIVRDIDLDDDILEGLIHTVTII